MNAIDTNIFIYIFDPADLAKQVRARQLVLELVSKPHESVLLWQVAAEFLAFLRKAQGQGRTNRGRSQSPLSRSAATVRAQASHGTGA